MKELKPSSMNMNKMNMKKQQAGLNKDFSSNMAMKYIKGNNHEQIFYLPTYVRCRILSITKVQYSQMTAEVNAEIYVTVKYPTDADNKEKQFSLKESILKQGINCSFEKGPCLNLKRDNVDISIQMESFGMVTYILRAFVSASLVQDDIVWAPFETITCRLSLQLRRVRLCEAKQGKIYLIHFNLMDIPQGHKKIVASPYAKFGMFGIDKNSLTANFTRSLLLSKNKKNTNDENDSIIKKKLEGKIKPDAFNSAHFTVKLYNKPDVAIVTIFLPLLMMAVLNLGVFYQRPNLHMRILSISALMIAIVALVPTIRQQIPQTPKITIVEALVFLESITTILALIDSLRLGDLGDDDPYIFDGLQNGYFIVSLVITCFVNFTVVLIFLIYKFKWERSYQLPQKDKASVKALNFEEQVLEIDLWNNKHCEGYFVKFYDQQFIQVLPDKDMAFKKEYSSIQKKKNTIKKKYEKKPNSSDKSSSIQMILD